MKIACFSLSLLLMAAALSAQTVDGSGNMIFSTNGTERMRITAGGFVGIGTTSPAAKLHVMGGQLFVGISSPLTTGDKISVLDSLGAQRFDNSAGNAPNFTFTRSRGTEGAPVAAFNGDETGRFLFRAYDGSGVVTSARIGAVIDGTVSTGSVPQAVIFKTGADSMPAERMRIDPDGNVGIGTNNPSEKLHVMGNVVVTGSITGATVVGAVYQDVAEWVPATTDLAPGTVVVLNPSKNNEVMASAAPYDMRVAGVVSAQPGVLLGAAGEGKEQIATTGRVKVRVDARRSAVRVGDLLVTSDVPGTAMKSEPLEINGRRFHQPGTILGKALEPLDGGIGEILVLLSMQ